jgi:hypothetical protein
MCSLKSSSIFMDAILFEAPMLVSKEAILAKLAILAVPAPEILHICRRRHAVM